MPEQRVNLLRSAGMASRIFSPKTATFFQFYVYFNVTQARQTVSLLLFNNVCPVISYRREFKRKWKRRIIVYGFGHSLWSANQLSKQRVNFLLSAEMTSRFFSPKIATFSQFYIYLNVIQARQTISLLLFNNFRPVVSFRREFKRKRKQRIIVYGPVTRYGPRTSCQSKGLISYLVLEWRRDSFLPKLQHFLSFMYI